MITSGPSPLASFDPVPSCVVESAKRLVDAVGWLDPPDAVVGELEEWLRSGMYHWPPA